MEGTARTPYAEAAVQESTVSHGLAKELGLRAIDGAAQTTAGSLSQLQYSLALGTSIVTLGIAAGNYTASGYSALKSANAAKRSAVVN